MFPSEILLTILGLDKKIEKNSCQGDIVLIFERYWDQEPRLCGEVSMPSSEFFTLGQLMTGIWVCTGRVYTKS